MTEAHPRPTRGERGASAVEYGLLIAGIAALIAVVVFGFGDAIRGVLFDDTCQEMVNAGATGDCI
jgi:pilus assembly protein Flp/PilA